MTQLVVVTHSRVLLDALDLTDEDETARVEIYKDCGETRIVGQDLLTTPAWDWGSR